VFDTCAYHRILSAAWECRRNDFEYVEIIEGKYGLSEDESILVQKSIDKGYCHDEFIKYINSAIDLESV